jgi:hypothetical protein
MNLPTERAHRHGRGTRQMSAFEPPLQRRPADVLGGDEVAGCQNVLRLLTSCLVGVGRSKGDACAQYPQGQKEQR